MRSIFSMMQLVGMPIDLIKTMQIMFDLASAQQKKLWEETFIDKWFSILPSQYGLTVSSVIGKSNIRFMASVIGNDALTPLRPTDGFGVFNGEIPRLGHKFVKTASDIRKMKELFENNRLTDAVKARELEKLMTMDMQDAYMGVKDALSYIVLQALSNEGVARFNSLNNADGRLYEIDYGMPAGNKKIADHQWVDDNSDSIDVLALLQKIKYEYSAKGIGFGELVMSPEVLYWMLGTDKLRRVIHGSDKSDSLVTEAQFNSTLTAWGLPSVTLVNKKVAVQHDGNRTLLDAWNGDFICFKPAGLIGEIQPAFEDNEIMEEKDVDYINATDSIRIAKWQVGESTGQVAGEYTQASTRALPIIKSIDGIVSLRVRGGVVPMRMNLGSFRSSPDTDSPDTDSHTSGVLTEGKNVADSVVAINGCDDIEVLKAALVFETGAVKPRSTVIAPLNTRIAELSA